LTEQFHLGIKNQKKSNLPEAKRFLSICLEDDSSNIEYNYWMAKTYISANALEKAKNTINKILTLDPSFSPAYELLGNIYLKNYKTQAEALEYYKLAAEWGVTSKIKTVEAYKIKFKLDKNLFEDEMSQEPIEINNMIFEYDEEKKYYAKILKVDNRIDFQFLSTTDLNSGYGTSMEFKQSRKNPNLYIWKPNPNYRLIVTKNFIIYYFPDGNNLFKPVKL
jgi:tetratricopeptide (TPR) repeat protein